MGLERHADMLITILRTLLRDKVKVNAIYTESLTELVSLMIDLYAAYGPARRAVGRSSRSTQRRTLHVIKNSDGSCMVQPLS